MKRALLTLLAPTLVAAAPTLAAAQEPPPGLGCLQRAYPEVICEVTATEAVLCDGQRIPWDDGVTRQGDELLDHADLRDQMSQPYPVGTSYPLPIPPDVDPGRARSLVLFKKLYGDSPRAVEAQLTTVRWFNGKALRVTRAQGVHERLQAVSDAIGRLPAEVRDKVAVTSGTFVWRTVRGTGRLSAHAFAIAIDVGVPLSDFWRWTRPDKNGLYPYRNRIPLEVVQIFEEHGFIWGGKWYHFDTMHFEYRPELLDPRCRAQDPEP